MNFIVAIPFDARLAILFVLGCCVGAVINLGIYRLAWFPRQISPWSPRAANTPPRSAWDRLPVIGWLGLRREAPLHGGGFWIRPMLIELLTGSAFALLYWWEIGQRGLIPPNLTMLEIVPNLRTIRHQQYVAHIVLLSFMLVAFWIDFDEMTIPDGITIPGTLLGLAIVTLWPYALLPESFDNASGPWDQRMAIPVWLTSPDQVPLTNLDDDPRFIMPWQRAACTGWPALVAAIAAFWVWCLALMPGRWSRRHGFSLALRVFTARMVRERGTYALLALAVIGSAVIAWVWRAGGPHWAALETGLAGIVIGGGLVWIVRILATRALNREAMGFGDVTLLAMIGAFLGWQAAVLIFFLSPLAALVIGMARLLLRGDMEIAFGPFLCLAAAGTVLVWPTLWEHVSHYFALGWKLLAVLLGALALIVVILPPVSFALRWVMARVGKNTGASR